jgi:hypothetical protein
MRLKISKEMKGQIFIGLLVAVMSALILNQLHSNRTELMAHITRLEQLINLKVTELEKRMEIRFESIERNVELLLRLHLQEFSRDAGNNKALNL